MVIPICNSVIRHHFWPSFLVHFAVVLIIKACATRQINPRRLSNQCHPSDTRYTPILLR